MKSIEEISNILNNMEKADIPVFLMELFTQSEIEILSKRWRIIKMLHEGRTQREVAKELGVGLCKVTRGAKILKENTITRRIIEKE